MTRPAVPAADPRPGRPARPGRAGTGARAITSPGTPPRRRARALAAATALLALAAAGAAPAQDAASITELICGRTVHYFNTDLGNQIEYTAPDGTAYLWFTGSDSLAIGTWTVTELTPEAGEVCYVYRPGDFGPEDPGSTFCFVWEDLVRDVPESGVREGDPYRLAAGLPPFALPFDVPVSLDDLRAAYPDQPPERACGLLMM